MTSYRVTHPTYNPTATWLVRAADAVAWLVFVWGLLRFGGAV